MTAIFNPKKPDTSVAEEQLKMTKDDREKTEAKNKAALNAARSGQSGRSLFAYAGEQGVDAQKTKLGAN